MAMPGQLLQQESDFDIKDWLVDNAKGIDSPEDVDLTKATEPAADSGEVSKAEVVLAVELNKLNMKCKDQLDSSTKVLQDHFLANRI